MFERYIRYAGYQLGRVADKLQNKKMPVAEKKPSAVWFDVGAHLGEYTIGPAKENPSLLVYAFEPNISLAMRLVGFMPNYIVIPMALAEQDGCADFYINQDDSSSSLLPIDPEGIKLWKCGDQMNVERKVSVPTIRLDTFLNLAKIEHVDFLKIDAQGVDLSVVKSAGDRIKDVDKILLEVITTPFQLYVGNPTKDETIDYLVGQGFALVETDTDQSYGQAENLTFIRNP